MLCVQQLERKVELRVKQYERFCTRKGLITKTQQAEAFGVDRTYIGRVLSGLRDVNIQFVAGVLGELETRFEDVFEVVEEPLEAWRAS